MNTLDRKSNDFILLQSDIRSAWENYKIYADSCVRRGCWPASFGCTEREKSLREKLKECYSERK